MELFNKEDVISWSNRNEVKLGDEGYFGYSLQDLEREIKAKRLRELLEIDEDSCSPFKGDTARGWVWHPFFLPIDKVKNQDSIYRPLKTFDELFSFLMADIENQKIDRHQKAQLLIGEQITLRRKEDNFIKVITINEVGFYDNDDSKDNYLNSYLVDELFHYYEILIDGEWVPFGIKEE